MKRIYVVLGLVLLFGRVFGWAQRTEVTTGVAVSPPASAVTGAGASGYLPLWTGSSTLGSSKLVQADGNVGIGVTKPGSALDVAGHIDTTAGYRIDGSNVLTLSGTLADANLAVGYLALPHGGELGVTLDTGVGASALNALVAGGFETAVGAYALSRDTSGLDNSALGAFTLWNNSDGQGNTAIGAFALEKNTSGNNNIALGYLAAHNVAGLTSNNIHIGSQGAGTDNGAIRIGTAGTQVVFFAAGVSGVTTDLADAVPVVIDGNGQLGTVNSSRRFKEDIQDMGDASRGLMRLRPVTFRYQKAFADGAKPVQYGLIAEEVAQVYPELVVHAADGQIQTVKYQVLDSMLLNEVQRQQAEIRMLQARLAKIEDSLTASLGTRETTQDSAIAKKGVKHRGQGPGNRRR